MKITKELEALVISTLSRMDSDQFRRTLKAALDGRRLTSNQEPEKHKAKQKEPKKVKKLHWKTKLKLEREMAEKATKKKVRV